MPQCGLAHCTRRSAAVIALNVPLVIIATRGFAVLSLFLVGNLLTCCAIVPLMLGLVPALRRVISETGFVVGVVGERAHGCAAGVCSLLCVQAVVLRDTLGNHSLRLCCMQRRRAVSPMLHRHVTWLALRHAV